MQNISIELIIIASWNPSYLFIRELNMLSAAAVTLFWMESLALQ